MLGSNRFTGCHLTSTDGLSAMKALPARPLALILTAAVVGLAGCAAPAPAAPTPSAIQPAPAATSARAATSAPATIAPAAGPVTATSAATVTIQNFLFAPVDLTVAPGATVTVVNQDGANHTLTAKDHSFDTGNIPGNGKGTFTAPTKPGAYPYLCAIHPFMTGMLTVS